MSTKTEVIDFINLKIIGHDDVLDKIHEAINHCDDNGILQELNAAYKSHNPSVEFANANDPDAESGAYYDPAKNKLVIKSDGDAGQRADMFLFESFNCVHREDYDALAKDFSRNYPFMYFLDYGRKKSDIEGKATYGYVSLLREIKKNHATYQFVDQGKLALKKNENIMSEDQLMASMTWTAHDPSGTGDWQFTSPRHYAFRKVMDLTPIQARDRINQLIVNAAVRDNSNGFTSGKDKLKAYNQIDSHQLWFQNWWMRQWRNLLPVHRPTAFISICEKANEIVRVGNNTLTPLSAWIPITLADYQFDTGMELEARRLGKRSPLTGNPM